jgi:hypothetical protein
MGGKQEMKKALVLILGVCFVALLIGSVAARDVVKPGLRVAKDWTPDPATDAVDPGLRGLYETAAVDTYCLVWYNFEQMSWQGWTTLDQTAQWGTFWHVDDFAGLGGGSFGGYVPLEGTKSMWCGARPNSADPYLCSWKRAPGYGNGWSQDLGTAAFAFTGGLTVSYKCHYDSEPDYDFTRFQYDAGGGNWQTVEEYTADGDTTAQVFLALTQSRTKLRFHFSADGAWSDQDGLWNTDGGSIVDSIRVRDNAALNNYQNFEAAAVGATSAGIWIATPATAYGSYAGLRNNLSDKDPCGDNFATQVVYFVGSPEPSASYPGLYDTPFCKGAGGITAPCQDELIISPIIDMTKYSTACNSSQNGTIPAGDLSLLGGALMRFTAYRDIPLPNLVFYQWHVRQWSGTYASPGCPGQWLDRNFVYYGPDQDYIYGGFDVSDLVGGASPIQMSVGCVDMCDVWYLVNGNCAAHTPSPWIDNVRFYRYKTSGPQWSYRDLDLFQDNFPEVEYNLESYVRADAANDIFTNDNPVIHPGDSIVVNASSLLGGGINTDPTFGGPAVYIHVKCTYIGPAPTKPNLYGPTLAGSTVHGTSPAVVVNYNYVSDDGVWTIIQCDTARTGAGIVEDKYCVDLNDELFTRGYEIEYYFTATDSAFVETALPSWARSYGPYFEFTCLPTKNSDVLFVDDCTDRGGGFRGGAENYWVPTFHAVLAPPNDNVDIYDVNGPTSGVSNGPGSRAKNRQLVDQYYKIIWDSGDLESVTISDGTVQSDKSNDCQMLIDWMDLSEHRVGLWVCGDDVAYDLDQNDASTTALTLMSSRCGVDFVTTSYFELTGGRTAGGVVTPLMTGDTDLNLFVHSGVPDKFYAFGGCFVINQFDVLDKTANGKYALHYPMYNSTNYYGAIGSAFQNGGGYDVKTMWFGFSWQYIRDDVVSTPKDQFEIAKDVFNWMQNPINANVTDTPTPKAYKLAQNFPNPFNPTTSIKFDMKDKGMVTLKVYNVAGQLVRTLVNGTKDAGSYAITWDGKNDRGSAVASGIYFYKMETKDFSQTKKMVMLR